MNAIKRNDYVVLNNDVRSAYGNTVYPAGTKCIVWKARRNGEVAVSPENGHSSLYLHRSQVTRINAPAATVKVGDIYVSTGGYEQTNVTFYRVSAVKKASLEVVEIGGDRKYTGPMCGEVTPILTSDGRNRKTVRFCVNGDGTVSFKAIWGSAYRWNGEPEFFSEWH